MANKLNLSVDQGADFWYVFVWEWDGVPYDLTGYTAHMQLRRDPGATDIDLDLSTTNGGISITPILTETTSSDGTVYQPTAYPSLITIHITNQQADLLTGKYTWDIKLFSPGGLEYMIWKGVITAVPSTTRE